LQPGVAREHVRWPGLFSPGHFLGSAVLSGAAPFCNEFEKVRVIENAVADQD